MKILMFLAGWVAVYTATNNFVTRKWGRAYGQSVAMVISGLYGLAVLLYLMEGSSE